jgi:hypothetical protein
MNRESAINWLFTIERVINICECNLTCHPGYWRHDSVVEKFFHGSYCKPSKILFLTSFCGMPDINPRTFLVHCRINTLTRSLDEGNGQWMLELSQKAVNTWHHHKDNWGLLILTSQFTSPSVLAGSSQLGKKLCTYPLGNVWYVTI